jgi:adenosine deaminase CECR1
MATNDAANDDEWAQAEGVPSLTDPFIQQYLQGRDALVQQEKRQRSGWWPKSHRINAPCIWV